MDWTNLFKVKVTRPCNQMPQADEFWVVIKQEIPACTLRDVEVKSKTYEYRIPVGDKLLLKRIPNPFGFTDPWLITSGMVIGASERWWRDQIESGAMDVEAIVK